MKAFVATLVVTFSLLSVAAEASSISFRWNAPGDYTGPGGCGGSSTSATYSATCTGVGLTSAVSYDATTLDTLKLYLNSGGTFPSGPEPFSEASLRVIDTLTVTGGVGSGTLLFSWAVDGTLDASNGYVAYLDFAQGAGGGTSFATYLACGSGVDPGLCTNSLGPVSDVRSISIPFVYGTPLTLTWELSAAIGDACIFDNGCDPAATSTGSGNVDFGHTFQLQPLLVFGPGGSAVGGASVVSTSGFSYAVAPVASPVPEPTTFLLIGTGLAVVGVRRVRTRLGALRLTP